MKHSKLRIAWSVAWSIAAILLVALGFRSYYWLDCVDLPFNVQIGSVGGNLMWMRANPIVIYPLQYHKVSAILPEPRFGVLSADLKLYGVNFPKNATAIPHSCAALFFATMGLMGFSYLMPRHLSLPRSFSIRALLIATTFIAIGLGLLVWLAK